ncbi:glycosyltransferase [Lactiplantibacillus plantarum]|uniref:glycosyltransferase n=1 Tax=Lactiplantibacillus plantarum TaxID=1590 RepID=UPI000C7F3B87|nr:glycosyltransferase [Lactiplantibacillus plantarum]
MSKVSVIIPTFNNADTICRAIDSCISQSFQNIEILVVDNGSTDKTRELVLKYTDRRVRYLNSGKPNRSRARNFGIKQATGKFLQFLDSDDTLKQNKIKHDVQILDTNSNYWAIADAYEFISPIFSEVRHIDVNTKKLLGHNIFHTSTVFMKNDNIKFFNEELSYCEDWLFWVENFHSKKVIIDNEFIGCTQVVTGTNTMTNQKKMLEFQMIVRMIIKNKFNVHGLWIIKNDIILMFTFLICCKKSNMFDKIINEFYPIYQLCRFLLIFPIIGKMIRNKVSNVVETNDFVKGKE